MQTQMPSLKTDSILKNKDDIFFETSSLELANIIRVSLMQQFAKLRPWIFVNKLWNGIKQNDYYVISIMNEHNHSYDQTTIDQLQLHIFNLNMEYNLQDEKDKQLDIIWA